MGDRPTFKLENKELDSTFGEEWQFQFKAKQPKRKLNVRNGPKDNTGVVLESNGSFKSLFYRNSNN